MKIERLLRQFESGHHAVSVVEGITSDLIGCVESTKMAFLTQDQFKRTEKGLIVLIYSMICQFFPEITLIENATRLKFLQRFYDQFVPIYRSEMTVRKFSDPEFPYAIVLPGGCVDLNNLEQIIAIKNLEHRKQVSSAFCLRIFDFINKKYRPLNISRLEFASIAGLLFWNCGIYF
uniref:Uncharacterized protein n=1 Tax=Meloidogyne incognita TaxID=6306 RepID=A0A914MEM8_MELIC